MILLNKIFIQFFPVWYFPFHLSSCTFSLFSYSNGLSVQTLKHLLSYLQERHHTKVQYQLKSERISLAQVFSKMEQVVEVLGIEDYSVSQTTLDNVSQHGSLCFFFFMHNFRTNQAYYLFFCSGVCQLCQEAERQPGAAGGVAPQWWTVPPAAHPQPAEVSARQHGAQCSDQWGAGGAGEWRWWRTHQLWRGKGEWMIKPAFFVFIYYGPSIRSVAPGPLNCTQRCSALLAALITSAKDVMFLPAFVCLFVCLIVSKITPKVENRFLWSFQ